MTLKGNYNPEETYEADDIYLWNDDAYRVVAAGHSSPMYLDNCVRLSPEIAMCAQMIISYHPPAAPMPHEVATPKPTNRRNKEA